MQFSSLMAFISVALIITASPFAESLEGGKVKRGSWEADKTVAAVRQRPLDLELIFAILTAV
jgi:hypothetical protein